MSLTRLFGPATSHYLERTVFMVNQRLLGFVFFLVAHAAAGEELPDLPKDAKSSDVKSSPFTYSNGAFRQDLDNTPWTELTAVTVTVSNSGHPVFVGVVPIPQSAKDQTPEPYVVTIASSTAVGKGRFTAGRLRIMIVRDSAEIALFFDSVGFYPTSQHLYETTTEIPYGLTTVDLPGAGEHTYQIKIKASGPIEIKGARLVAYEL